MTTTSTAYTVGDYLLDRLHELGVEHVFGVPGDFTLSLLDHVVDHHGLRWVGCTNELNAGYAADGYARMRSIGAVMTTFGVGELSAINAIAGSYAEHVPVVHIVGSPATRAQAAQRMVHHSLGDGVFDHFLGMLAPITCARATLTAEGARGEIDRVLQAVRDNRLPGYLLLPSDVTEHPTTPPAGPLPPPYDPSDPDAVEAFRTAATQLLAAAPDRDRVVVLAGLLVHRFGAAAALQKLLAAGVPHATSAWSKSLVDETNPDFLGLYAGGLSEPAVDTALSDAACLIVAGIQFTDLNSGFFTQQIDRDRTIELGAVTASVGTDTFEPVSITAAVQVLADLLRSVPSGAPAHDRTADRTPISPASPARSDHTDHTDHTDDVGRHSSNEQDPATRDLGADAPLNQQALWSQVAAAIQPGDVVVAEQGTSFFGMATHRLCRDVTFIGQPLWASIGYTLPATLGAVLATGRRALLLIGDGAAQMTATELSTIARAELPVMIVIVDNGGYTVERAIHGPDAAYNDIPTWDWTALLTTVGAGKPSLSTCADTTTKLEHALRQARTVTDRPTLIQAVVPRLDVPPFLQQVADAAAAANAAVPAPTGTAS